MSSGVSFERTGFDLSKLGIFLAPWPMSPHVSESCFQFIPSVKIDIFVELRIWAKVLDVVYVILPMPLDNS